MLLIVISLLVECLIFIFLRLCGAKDSLLSVVEEQRNPVANQFR